MITRKQSIEYFSTRMDELITSNYLLADKKITNVLKTATTSKLFYELICFTIEGFNFAEYYASLTKGEFFPTKNKKNFIAFAFCLFCEIDCKNEDILNVLSIYYRAENFDRSYKLFADNFLIPFKKMVVSIAEEMVRSTEENDQKGFFPEVLSLSEANAQLQKGSAQTAIPPETKKYLTCYKDIQKILISEKAKIIHCRHIKDNEKSDLLVLLDRFKDCLSIGNKEEIKTSFISYKYAVLAFKRIESEVEDVERILKFCKIF